MFGLWKWEVLKVSGGGSSQEEGGNKGTTLFLEGSLECMMMMEIIAFG